MADPSPEQTLEEILQEDDSMDPFLSMLEVTSKNSISTSLQKGGKDSLTETCDITKYIPHYDVHEKSPVLLPKPLSTISQVLASPKMRAEAGYPTCIAVERSIIIGTAHGIVLLFDHRQQLIQKLGNAEQIEKCDSVTSIAIAPDQDYIAVGHMSGFIALWDFSSGTILKSIPDIHKHAILHLKFSGDYSRLISGDKEGFIYKNTLLYRLMYYSIDSIKVLGGSGAIYALETLPHEEPTRPIDSFNLMAIASPKAVFILALEPQIKIIFKLPRPAPSNQDEVQLPYLSWRPSKKETILAIAWGTTIQLIQAKVKGENDFEFSAAVKPFLTPQPIVGMRWIGSSSIGYLNHKDELVALDPFNSVQMETMDIRAMELVYHTRFSQRGNSMDYCSFHNSYYSYKNQVFLLGIQRMYSASIIPWNERLDLLEREGKWTSALALCLCFYKEEAPGVVGLPTSSIQIRKITAQRIEDMLNEKIKFIFNALQSDHVESRSLRKIIVSLAELCIQYFVAVDKTKTLFDVIFPLFVKEGQRTEFLELLEPFILNDQLRYLGPSIMQEFVDHYREIGKLEQVEQCIVHLDISSLDFHQAVTLCRQEKLTSGLIYLYTSGLRDYITPFQDLIEMSQSDNSIKKNILLYLGACLEGKSYNSGHLSVENIPWVKAEALGFVFDTNQNRDTKEQWPRVCFFYLLDAKEFLRTLSFAFDDPLFSEENLSDLLNEADKPAWVQFDSVTVDHQVLMECMYQCIIDQSASAFSVPVATRGWRFSVQHQSQLLSFMAKYFAKRTISLNDVQLNRVLGYLSLTMDSTTLREREILLYSLLRTCPVDRYSSDKLLLLAEGAGMLKVQELFYLRASDYNRVLHAYVKDKERSNQIFTFILSMMSNPYVDMEEKELVKSAALDHLTELVQIDSTATSELVIEYFTAEHENIWQRLKKHPLLQYEYLKTIMKSSNSMDELISRKGIQITSQMHEAFIKLLCQFSPTDVYRYLLIHTDYRLDYCLSICQHYDILDASTYLLERTGDVSGALDVILQQANQNICILMKLVEDSVLDKMYEEESKLRSKIQIAIVLCQRNSSSLPEEENKALWFQLLDSLVVPLRKMKTKRNRRGMRMNVTAPSAPSAPSASQELINKCLTENLTHILHNMMGFVPLRAIMEKIVRDHSSAQFTDFKPIILAMLDTYTYETNILEAAKRLFNTDHFEAHKAMKQKITTGFRGPSVAFCLVCQERANPLLSQKEFLVFECGHNFHCACLAERVFSCPFCDGILDQIFVTVAEPEGDDGDEQYQIYMQRAQRFAITNRI